MSGIASHCWNTGKYRIPTRKVQFHHSTDENKHQRSLPSMNPRPSIPTAGSAHHKATLFAWLQRVGDSNPKNWKCASLENHGAIKTPGISSSTVPYALARTQRLAISSCNSGCLSCILCRRNRSSWQSFQTAMFETPMWCAARWKFVLGFLVPTTRAAERRRCV
jgi:hypothetical protein